MDRFNEYLRLVAEGVPMSNMRRSELIEEMRDHLEICLMTAASSSHLVNIIVGKYCIRVQ